MIRICLIVIVAIVALSGKIYAQSDLPVIGSLEDIKGLSKVYVIADTDSRKAIVKEIESSKGLSIVGDPADAEFFLEYKSISKDTRQTGIFRVTSEKGQLEAFVNRGGKKIVAFSESTTGSANKGDTAHRLTETFLKLQKKAAR